MKKIVLLFSMLVAMTASAQHDVGTWTVTPKIGMNLAAMTESNVDYQSLDGYNDGPLNSKMTVSFAVGAEGEYQIHKMVGLGAGLIYSRQGMDYKHDGLTSTTKLDYLNIPLTANVYVVKDLAGLTFSGKTDTDGKPKPDFTITDGTPAVTYPYYIYKKATCSQTSFHFG